MGEEIAQLAMSLDGFIADPDDNCDELFGFYGSGDVAVKLSKGFPELHVSQTTADLLTASVAKSGATVVGRRPMTSPMAGTDTLAAKCPWSWSLITRLPTGHATACRASSRPPSRRQSRRRANWPASGTSASPAPRSPAAAWTPGLLDAIHVSLVPVILGHGIPWLSGTRGPVRLCDPEVIEDRGVTHLRYVIRK
jgi:hypothetical protein